MWTKSHKCIIHPSIHPSTQPTINSFIHPSIHPSIPPSWYTGKQPTGFILTPGRLLSSEPQVPTLLCQRTCIISTYLPTHLPTYLPTRPWSLPAYCLCRCTPFSPLHLVASLSLSLFSGFVSCNSHVLLPLQQQQQQQKNLQVVSHLWALYLKSIFPTSNKVSISCAC